MAVRLFKLRDVPEDEAEDVRGLLDKHDISFYETYAGNWGLGTPAIWPHDETRFAEAKVLIDAYEAERFERMRAEHLAMAKQGTAPGMFGAMCANPLRFLLFIAMILFILYVSLAPFIDFGQ